MAAVPTPAPPAAPAPAWFPCSHCTSCTPWQPRRLRRCRTWTPPRQPCRLGHWPRACSGETYVFVHLGMSFRKGNGLQQAASCPVAGQEPAQAWFGRRRLVVRVPWRGSLQCRLCMALLWRLHASADLPDDAGGTSGQRQLCSRYVAYARDAERCAGTSMRSLVECR